MIRKRTILKRQTVGAAMLMALAIVAALTVPAFAAQAAKTKIDLNTADLKTLTTLPGIGETLAQRIIDGRPYKTIDDLGGVKGLGQSKIDALKDLVTFSKVKPPKEAAAKVETKTVSEKAATTTAVKEEPVLVNVNKADLETLQTLPGIGEALAKRIIDGRPYKTIDDLGKVKGVGEAKLEKIKDLVAFEDKVKVKTVKAKTIPAETAKVTETTKAKETTKATETVKAAETAKSKEAVKTTEAATETALINVNKADLETLQNLPGIGEVLAKRIIDGRPYKTIDDLGKVKGIGEAKLEKIKDLVVFEDKVKEKPVKTTTAAAAAKTTLAPGEKLNINTATAEQLDALFGIGPVKAQAIVDYRTANGKFQTIEDIMKVKGIKEGEFAKIKDFIKVK